MSSKTHSLKSNVYRPKSIVCGLLFRLSTFDFRLFKRSKVSPAKSSVFPSQSSVCSRAGFTLLELMTVMVIMFIMMGVATVSLRGVLRGAGISGAVSNVRAVLTQARQHAIMKQQETSVDFTSSGMQIRTSFHDWDACKTESVDVGPLRSVPESIEFSDAPKTVTFTADGAAKAKVKITMREVNATDGAKLSIDVDTSGKITIK